MCLLHGLFGRAQNFGALARHLSGRHRVISLDLRNHGASPQIAGMAYGDMAADVLRILHEREMLPCSVVGHSMGGKVAMAAALTAPDAVARLVVADIAPVPYHHANTRIAAALLALELAPGLDRRAGGQALAADVPDPAVRSFLLQNLEFGTAPAWKIGLQEIAAGIADIEGWPEAFSNLQYHGPALFVIGERSDYVNPQGVSAIERSFPRQEFVTLPGAGHWVHADQPALFAEAVAAFLAK